MEIQSKTCNNCGEKKPLSEFYSRSPGSTGGRDYAGSLAGVSAECKVCVRAYAAARRKRLGPIHAKYMKDFDLRRKYGIGLDQFNQMFADQSGCCAICGRHQMEFAKGLVVDHDHKTGIVRKLLCPNCNAAIGMLGEDIGLLAKAIEYIQTHAASGGISKPTASGKVVENGAEKDDSPLH